MSDQETSDLGMPDTECSYEAFGRRFFAYAVTQERVEAGLGNLTGNTFDFGPRKIGPGGLASISASGRVGDVTVQPIEDELIRFSVAIPIHIELKVRLAAQNHRFEADLKAHLRLTARALEPLRIFIDVEPPSEADVEVDVEAQGLRASVLEVIADIKGELKRFVARHIQRQIDKPDIRDMREIDVADKINGKGQG